MTRYGKIESQSGTLSYQGKHHYRGIAPYPANLLLLQGSTWEEFNFFGEFVGDWIWNGTYWLSTQAFVDRSPMTLGTAFSAATSSVDFPCDEGTNLWIESAIVAVQVNAASTAANYWAFTLSRINAAGTATTLLTQNTQGQAAKTWVNYSATLNLHVDLTATGTKTLRLADSRPAGTIQRRGTQSVKYRLARK